MIFCYPHDTFELCLSRGQNVKLYSWYKGPWYFLWELRRDACASGFGYVLVIINIESI